MFSRYVYHGLKNSHKSVSFLLYIFCICLRQFMYVPFCTIPNGPDKTSFPFAEYRFVSLYILTSFSEI